MKKAFILTQFFLLSLLALQAQVTQTTIPELVFSNPINESGTPGADNAVYRFGLISSQHDALVKISGRSDSNVSLSNIDLTSTGFGKAFQPQVKYSGTLSAGMSYWIEFEITFVNKSTATLASIASFYVSTLDVDGNSNMQEFNAFCNPASYTVESNCALQVINSYDGGTTPGRKFIGSTTEYAGIDTTATELMATLRYNTTSSLKLRVGGNITGNVSNPNRQHSLWFKGFSYNNPIIMPVKLNSFQGSKNKNNVQLQWDVSINEIANTFEVERSADGRNFETVAMLLGTEKTGNETYSYSEANEDAKVYYRLRMTDKSNVVSYSKVLVFNSAANSSKPLNILGNVVNDKLTFSFDATTNTKAELRIVDLNGRLMMSQAFTTSKGNNLASISLLASLKGGMYIAVLWQENTYSTAKFMKQ